MADSKQDTNSIVRGLLRQAGYLGPISDQVLFEALELYYRYGEEDFLVFVRDEIEFPERKIDADVETDIKSRWLSAGNSYLVEDYERKNTNFADIPSALSRVVASYLGDDSREIKENTFDGVFIDPLSIQDNMPPPKKQDKKNKQIDEKTYDESFINGVWLYHPGDTEDIKNASRDLCIARGKIEPGSGALKGPLIQSSDGKGGFTYHRKYENKSLTDMIVNISDAEWAQNAGTRTQEVRNRIITGVSTTLNNMKISDYIGTPLMIELRWQDIHSEEDADYPWINCVIRLWVDNEGLRREAKLFHDIGIAELSRDYDMATTRRNVTELVQALEKAKDQDTINKLETLITIEQKKIDIFNTAVKPLIINRNELLNKPSQELYDFIRKRMEENPGEQPIFDLLLGITIGQFTVVHKDGWLREYGYYKKHVGSYDSLQNGPSEQFDAQGKVIKREFYKNGKNLYVSSIKNEFVLSKGNNRKIRKVREDKFLDEKGDNVSRRTTDFETGLPVNYERYGVNSSGKFIFTCWHEKYDEKGEMSNMQIVSRNEFKGQIALAKYVFEEGGKVVRTIYFLGKTVRVDTYNVTQEGDKVRTGTTIEDIPLNKEMTEAGYQFHLFIPFDAC